MLRKLLNRLVYGDRGQDLDHVPVGRADVVLEEQRAAKLRRARERLGHAFLCAAVDQDREVIIVPGTARIVKGGAAPTQRMVDRGNVERLRRTA